MKILVTYALPEEKGDIRMDGHELVFCCTGLGKTLAALATYRAIVDEKPDLVLNVGTAGTLKHRVGDILLCSRFVDRDLENLSWLGIPFRLNLSEELASLGLAVEAEHCVSTGDTFQSEVNDGHERTEADVFDMEAFAGAQACTMLNVPFLSVKYVTDVIGQDSMKSFQKKLSEAREDLARFLQQLSL